MDYLPIWPLDITPLMAFGLMLIIGAIGGYAAHHFSWLPSITGFMIVGFICGPSGIGLLSQHTIVESRILIDIALALILYRLGLSLDIKLLWRFPGLLFTSLVESAATFGLVAYVLHLFGIPFLLSLLVAAITISSSPAVLLHVAHEVGAKGVITESTKTLVALNNLFSFVAFSAILPALHYSAGSDQTTIIMQPLYSFFGSLVVGTILAFILHIVATKTHEASQYKLALVIGTIMVAVALAYELKLSMLFICLTIGIVVKSMEREKVVSKLEFGASFELFFIVLFVFAGAGLHLHEIIEFAPAVLALVLVRTLAKVIGVTAMSSLLKKPFRTGMSSGLLLLPMAGLAIGLVLTTSSLFPQHASTIAAIVFGAVTVFETIGPPIATLAFRFSGEAGRAHKKNTNNSGKPESTPVNNIETTTKPDLV
ncbi:cation:proton antiporter [Sulfurirhabdus autotrophica]|uniref:Kef-type K+ transport system membrane component KefB n=1 Tax=Sulfurirhabdus autotrophica TaxID=1706046 RepID=A0A4V2W257_9PROT|nr:cation:proton antiporter [Sulfurirhabdus autotrophica]TCV86769.1 Kef-type K+ transport system membrane component KefB [Sulfurirhabdus autotrophica]